MSSRAKKSAWSAQRKRLAFFRWLAKTSAGVVIRRLFVGPRHPDWNLRYELFATIARHFGVKSEAYEPAVLRARMRPASVHKQVKKLIHHERSATLAGLPAEVFQPKNWCDADPTVLYFHGGGYFSGSPATHRDLISRIASYAHARCIAVEYRKAPEFPFPTGIDDCESAYHELVSQGTPAERIILAGDSAGGGLALGVLTRLRDRGSDLPSGAVLISPWVDLEMSGVSIRSNAEYDFLTRPLLEKAVNAYAAPDNLRHPSVSAIHADLHDLPPMMMLSGSAELFLSENERLAERARSAGVDLDHEVFPGGVHVYPMFARVTPEVVPTIHRIASFVRRRSGRKFQPSRRPSPIQA